MLENHIQKITSAIGLIIGLILFKLVLDVESIILVCVGTAIITGVCSIIGYKIVKHGHSSKLIAAVVYLICFIVSFYLFYVICFFIFNESSEVLTYIIPLVPAGIISYIYTKKEMIKHSQALEENQKV